MKKILDILAWTPLGLIIAPILILNPSAHPKYLDWWWLGLNGAVMGMYAAIIIITVFGKLTNC